MRFAEAEQTYRELEDRLVRGEITEDEFTAQVANLRLVDEECRRWMLSPRTGRWLVHDGQQWVFAEPMAEKTEPEPEECPETEVLAPGADAEETIAAPVAPIEDAPRRSAAPRVLTTGVLALLLIGCLIGGGISAWVFLLRDWGATPTPAPSALAAIGPVETYTPRPATATFTPTPSPTPSRTPTPTITPVPTDTPPPTNTPLPSDTPPPTETRSAEAANTSSATEVAAASTPPPTENSSQTHVVQPGETLGEIASRYGLTVQELAKANDIDNPALVRTGQVLVIPAPGASASPTPTWTPIVLITSTAEPTASGTAEATPSSTVSTTPTPTATSQPTATPTESGPTPTPQPTNTPRPTATPTPKPVTLSGKIAFTVWNPHVDMGKYELYVSNVDGSGRNMLGRGFRQPQFRQDGNLLAVNGNAPNLQHLVTMDASGNGKVEVSNFTEDAYPTWSPDGAIVAYSSKSWGDGQSRLGIVHDMFGKNQDWIKIGTTEVRGEYPFWMADGRVVYHGCDFMNNTSACGLYWVGAGGGNYYRLTNHESDTAPAGSGSRVAFMSARDGNWEVYAVNMDGSGLQQLTNNNAQDGLPTWSPDGNSIAFVSDRGGAWAIWVMNANGNNQRKLFDLGGGYGSGEYDWTTERISWAP